MAYSDPNIHRTLEGGIKVPYLNICDDVVLSKNTYHVPITKSASIIYIDVKMDKWRYGCINRNTGNYQKEWREVTHEECLKNMKGTRFLVIRGKSMVHNFKLFLNNLLEKIKINKDKYLGTHFFTFDCKQENIFWNVYVDDENNEFIPHPVSYLGSRDKENNFFHHDLILQEEGIQMPLDKLPENMLNNENDIVFNDENGNFYIMEGKRKEKLLSLFSNKIFMPNLFSVVTIAFADSEKTIERTNKYKEDYLNKEKEEYKNKEDSNNEEKEGKEELKEYITTDFTEINELETCLGDDINYFREYLNIFLNNLSIIRHEEFYGAIVYLCKNVVSFLNTCLKDTNFRNVLVDFTNKRDFVKLGIIEDIENRRCHYFNSLGVKNDFNMEDPEFFLVPTNLLKDQINAFHEVISDENIFCKYLYKALKFFSFYGKYIYVSSVDNSINMQRYFEDQNYISQILSESENIQTEESLISYKEEENKKTYKNYRRTATEKVNLKLSDFMRDKKGKLTMKFGGF
jgi:hypothetical protein